MNKGQRYSGWAGGRFTGTLLLSLTNPRKFYSNTRTLNKENARRCSKIGHQISGDIAPSFASIYCGMYCVSLRFFRCQNKCLTIIKNLISPFSYLGPSTNNYWHIHNIKPPLVIPEELFCETYSLVKTIRSGSVPKRCCRGNSGGKFNRGLKVLYAISIIQVGTH